MHSSILCIRPFLRSDYHFGRTKESLPRSRSYGTIHFVRKKAIQYSLACRCVIAHVCLSGSAWQNPVDRSKRHRSQPLSGACNQPEPQTPFTCLSPFRLNCPFFPKNMSVRWAQQHAFFSFRKELLWSSALLLLSETASFANLCWNPTFFLVKNASCATGPRCSVWHPEHPVSFAADGSLRAFHSSFSP